jgi:GT2 family glycosyltransferase
VKRDLSIIIVNWNGRELLANCLASIGESPPSVPYEVMVVDNASTDQSVAWLGSFEARALLPQGCLRVIENEENLGFSKANNQAITLSRAPFVLLLNPDTEVLPGALDRLIATLRSDARIGACGPRLLNTDGSVQYSVWRNPPAPWDIVVSGIGIWRLIPRRLRGEWLLGRHWDHARRREVPMLFGAAMLARREMIADVGGLDERFHMYAEDNEWCLRMRRAGWRLVFEPDAEILHHGSRLSLQRWGRRDKLRVQLESYFQFQRYSLSRAHAVGNLLATCAVMALHVVWRRLRGRLTDEVELVYCMHLAELKRIVRASWSVD